MPLIHSSDYQPPPYLFNGHLQTIIPSQFRNVPDVRYARERLITEDQDFLLLDWSRVGSDTLVVISHGLEGDSQRPYIKGMVRAFNRVGYDVLAWNFRSCGGEINQTLRFYHSGATEDLHAILHHVRAKATYQRILLVGFSLGGNLTLKYVGERQETLFPEISGAIVFSVPLDLQACSLTISERSNFIYSWRFLNNLKGKIRAKEKIMPDKISTEFFPQIRTLQDFDDYYTAPMHGYKDAADYYRQCSSIHFLQSIQVPTLIVNAQNDPFLAKECYLTQDSDTSETLFFEAPEEGGHCGFMPKGYTTGDNFWSEDRAIRFSEEILAFHASPRILRDKG
ncbi:MAG: alpha/beta fold hydrolase [Cyclobacteriaceae bacterium]